MVARAANESWPGNVFDASRLDRPANNSDERGEGRRGIVTRKNADSLSLSLSLVSAIPVFSLIFCVLFTRIGDEIQRVK